MLEIEATSYDGTPLAESLCARFDQKGGTLGRSDDNKLVLHDPQKHVSRVHAEVVFADESYFLVCRSANRLSVNQVELDQGARRLLHEGDVIQIGSYSLGVRIREGVGPGTSPVPLVTPFQAAPPAPEPSPIDDPIGIDDVLGDLGIQPAPTSAAPTPIAELMPEYQPKISTSTIDWNAPPEFDNAVDQPQLFATPPAPNATVLPGASIDDIWGELSDAAEINPLSGGPLDPSTSAVKRAEMPVAYAPKIEQGIPPVPRQVRAPAPDPLFDDPLAAFGISSDDNTPARVDADPFLPPADVADAPSLGRELSPPVPEAPPPLSRQTSEEPALPLDSVADADDPLNLGLDSLFAPQTSAAPQVYSPAAGPDRNASEPGLEPVPPQRTSQRGEAVDELMSALAQGLGMSEFDLPERMTPEFARLLGRLMHESIKGTLELVNARAQARKEIRADLTLISPKRANNPLKHAPTAEVALKRLLSPTETGYMPGATALREAFRDIHSHHMGFMAGMQATMTSVLNRLRPDRIETLLGENKGMEAIVPSNRRARAWLAYQEHYQTVSTEVTNEFHAQLGKEFLNAYEAQVARAKGQNPIHKPV